MNDWDLSNIRADIMLATDIEHLQAIDNYYENIINNLQSKIDKAIEYIDKHFQDDEGIVYKIIGEYEAERNENFIKELLDILKEDK